MKEKLKLLLLFVVLLLLCGAAAAQDNDEGPQQSTTGPIPPPEVLVRDAIEEFIILAPPTSPVVIASVPDYLWRHGCGPTAVGMVVGYYDGQGYSDLITGDASTQTTDVNQAIASGGTSGNPNPPGSEQHYEDYAVPEDSPPTLLTDDYITAGRTPHTDDSIADYMDTSKSTRNNYYGWSWSSDVCPSFTGYVAQQNPSYNPVCTEYRWSNGTLTWAVLKNEIDNGRPMVFLVDSDGDGSTDHFVTIVGYDAPTNQYGCHDTWAPAGVRWETFQGIGSGAWSIWGGWTFQFPTEVVKYEQPPDETYNGIDIRCDRSDGIQRTLADDFLCTTPGAINKVVLWGSWQDDIKGRIQKIHLSIHSNNPMGPYGWSEPEELLWEKDFFAADFNETLYSNNEPEWFWDPTADDPPPLQADHFGIWQYEILIDSADAFVQQGDPCNPVIYWLDAYVELEDDQNNPRFGWKTSFMHWEDDAVYWDEDLPGWQELRYPMGYGHPYEGDSIDLAFRIITGEQEEPNEPVTKWIQNPDLSETGIDVDATNDTSGMSTWGPQLLADDFNCTTTGAITDIHIWGSWYHDYLPYNGPNDVEFTLSIHADLPVGDPCNPYNYSIPGQILWMRNFTAGDFKVTIEAQDITEGYYVPCEPYYEPDADWTCYRYDFYIDPCDAFIQQGDPHEPVVYWLDVQAKLYGEMNERFGWKTSLKHWNDDAVWASGDETNHGPWQELRYPPEHQLYGESIDLAFAITTEAGEPNEPNEPSAKPLMAHTKWSQPPVEVDPNSDIPTYCGWDQESYKTYQQPDWTIVADDFRCLGTMPITSIHWWGSFFDWEWWAHGTLPQVLPDAWRIGFWSNKRANSSPHFLPYSYPDMLLHSITIPAQRVHFEEVGSDEYYGYYPYDICYQYNVELEPNEVFWQDDYNDITEDDIYWLSIVAIYQTDLYPDHPWGWKTRPWHWMDDAVTFQTTDEPDVGFATDPLSITPIVDPQWGESFDMAFELDTDPNYIKWEQLYTGIRDWPHYEDVNSTLSVYGPDNELFVAADDWRCEKRTPVTAVVWWGSYIGYGFEACSDGPFMSLPNRPERFELAIWTDVPDPDPNDPNTYSHPGNEIWAFETYKHEYDEVLVGYDKHPHGGPNEPVFRYSVRLPEENWFHQPDYNEVFWLSIEAVYESEDPNYRWGWTNHQHVFNDDAVLGRYDEANEVWFWEELKDQTGASADMSFMLFTDPNECSTCANYNLDANVNFIDFAEFANQWCWSGPAGGYNNADLDCDGDVDLYDLGIFCQQWLQYCP